VSGSTSLFAELASQTSEILTERVTGRVVGVRGLAVLARGMSAPVGARCTIATRNGLPRQAEVIAVSGADCTLTVYSETTGIAPDDVVTVVSGPPRVPVGYALLGRVLNAHGEPIDNGPPITPNQRRPLYCDPPQALERRPIDTPLGLGIRAIDALLTAGRGQRLGIFAGTGVGKSVLMGTICRQTQAQVNVVALIGERGREVGDFVRHQLGPEGLARSVVVVCSSDEAPANRIRACFHAMSIAEFFRDEGLDVLFMMDSVTRVAMGQRQLGLAAGEPPATKGYPPSVFALLPRLLERAGRTHKGSITGLYTVLVEGDDLDDPISDTVRGILDGHVVLSRRLANRGHYPAVDVLKSVSRVAPDVVDKPTLQAALAVRRVLATWEEIEDLVSIGAYAPGANLDYDIAVQLRPVLERFLRQDRDEKATFEQSQKALHDLAGAIQSLREKK
jgi:flagellum-specific ATP synthase